MSALVRFVGRSFSTNSRPAAGPAACGGRPRAGSNTGIIGELTSPAIERERRGVVREQPYAAVFMRTGMAFTAEEMEALAELFAEDVVWHTRPQPALRRV
jgi:hypothetical protein